MNAVMFDRIVSRVATPTRHATGCALTPVKPKLNRELRSSAVGRTVAKGPRAHGSLRTFRGGLFALDSCCLGGGAKQQARRAKCISKYVFTVGAKRPTVLPPAELMILRIARLDAQDAQGAQA